MDPNRTLTSLLLAVQAGVPEDAAILAEDLTQWIRDGGFKPAALTYCVVVAERGGVIGGAG